MIKRGRPKGHSSDSRSFGPLGDIVRKHRLTKNFGLSEVAQACGFSIQFLSNIEHGRAPLPWNKTAALAHVLKIPTEELQAANLSIRSDFKRFMDSPKGKTLSKPQILKNITGAATVISLASKDSQLKKLIQKYQLASADEKKNLIQIAHTILLK